MRREAMVRRAVTALIVVVAGYHALSVTLAALPPNQVSAAARPATGYLDPYFTQNWRLFAPSPISADRSVHFRAAYREGEEVRTTEWLDWTAVELDLIRHKVIGGRAGYITNKMFTPLASSYGQLSAEQQQMVNTELEAATEDWQALAEALRDSGATPYDTRRWISVEQSATRLGSQVMRAAHPELRIVAVQYRLVSHRAAPYARRHDPAARPEPRVREAGWRAPIAGSEAAHDVVGDFWERHR